MVGVFSSALYVISKVFDDFLMVCSSASAAQIFEEKSLSYFFGLMKSPKIATLSPHVRRLLFCSFCRFKILEQSSNILLFCLCRSNTSWASKIQNTIRCQRCAAFSALCSSASKITRTPTMFCFSVLKHLALIWMLLSRAMRYQKSDQQAICPAASALLCSKLSKNLLRPTMFCLFVSAAQMSQIELF
jgi:hypothetical protein